MVVMSAAIVVTAAIVMSTAFVMPAVMVATMMKDRRARVVGPVVSAIPAVVIRALVIARTTDRQKRNSNCANQETVFHLASTRALEIYARTVPQLGWKYNCRSLNRRLPNLPELS